MQESARAEKPGAERSISAVATLPAWPRDVSTVQNQDRQSLWSRMRRHSTLLLLLLVSLCTHGTRRFLYDVDEDGDRVSGTCLQLGLYCTVHYCNIQYSQPARQTGNSDGAGQPVLIVTG